MPEMKPLIITILPQTGLSTGINPGFESEREKENMSFLETDILTSSIEEWSKDAMRVGFMGFREFYCRPLAIA